MTEAEVKTLWAAADTTDILATNYAAHTSVGAWVHGNVGSVVVCNKHPEAWGNTCDKVNAHLLTTTSTTTTTSSTTPAASNGVTTRGCGLVAAGFVALAGAAP
eukprot:GHVU01087147.1.p1 GENE.GHVU01087147.1~~GHVU01087147.1.p1  ORF type:complete len:110 (+),score=18.70 GHVU01087147.1:24-332(+)